MSLRVRLMLLAAVCVLPAALLLGAGVMQLRQAQEAEVRQQIAALAQSEADHIGGIIRAADQFLAALELSPPIRERNAPYCSALLDRLTRGQPSYAGIAVDDVHGRSVCTNEAGRAGYDGDQPYFRAVLEEHRLAVGGYVKSVAGVPVLPVARPILGTDGAVMGVLVVSLNLGRLAQELAATLPADTTLSVLDHRGVVLLQIPDTGSTGQSEPLTAQFHPPSSGRAEASDVVTPDSHTLIVARASAGDARDGLLVLAARDRDTAFAALDRATLQAGTLVAVALALALLIAGWMARRFIQRPIRNLLAVADRLRVGDFAVRSTGVADRSELGRLGRALDVLADALQEREQARAGAEDQLRQFAATLEQRVDERTRELAEANARVADEAAERQRTEAVLAQSQKLEALGQLTGGVAHDFNNLLTAIIGSLDLAMERNDDERVQRLIAVATQAAERGARLTQQMLAFSRKQDLSLQPVSVNDVVAGLTDLLGRTIGPQVRISHDLADNLWLAMADQVQLEVALLNLAVNAHDAMRDGGELMLRTRNVTLDGTGAAAAAPGDYAMLTVSDTGHGMSSEVMANAFEPFFTTKPAGKGTGLGLSMVYGFAQQAGGTVTIDSCLGRGTAVSIYLPRARVLPARDMPKQAMPAHLRHLRILLVDDDRDAREVTMEMLQELGHAVVAATDGPSGLARLRQSHDFDLLVVDYAMPGMTGAEMAAQAQSLIPELPILFMTGYVDSDGLHSWSRRGYRTLNKPFHIADLANALRGALGPPLDSEVP